MSGSNASWKSSGACGVPENFPAGLRVLVVDDDPTCLMILERMLKQCNYEAIMCNKAEIALSLLRENNDLCDIVLSDVHMPDIDGFKLLELIGLEMDIPVIMMSGDDNKDVMMKGITHGACDYIIKPVRMEALHAIWQHVVRKKQKRNDFKGLTSADDVYQHHKVPEDVEDTSSGNEGRNWRNIKRKEYEDEYERGETSSSKKPRVVWSIELHQKFVAAVNQLGLDRAVPKKILELMKVPGITRENIASHLQKYRLYLKRLNESKHPASIATSFMGCTLDRGYDRRALVGRGQFPSQSLTPLQTSVLDRLNNSRSLVPLHQNDERNTFNFGNPRFYGDPTNMAPNQFMGLNQFYQYPFNGVNNQVLMPMAGPSQGLNQSQPIFPSGMLGHGLGSNILGGGIHPSYNLLNGSNQNRPGLGSSNTAFTDWLSYSSSKQMGPTLSFAVNDVSGTHRNGTGGNQDDILSALLDQPEGGIAQLEDELDFDDGYAFDDLPKAP